MLLWLVYGLVGTIGLLVSVVFLRETWQVKVSRLAEVTLEHRLILVENFFRELKQRGGESVGLHQSPPVLAQPHHHP